MIKIEVTSQQTVLPVRVALLRRAARMILEDHSISDAQISLALVDDPTISGLNRRFLNHDCPTDVLSFPLERQGSRLEGEVVVSAETARREAPRYGWSAEDELLLYVIHGTLHLVGYSDTTSEEQSQMRAREQAYLARFGREVRLEQADEKRLAADPG